MFVVELPEPVVVDGVIKAPDGASALAAAVQLGQFAAVRLTEPPPAPAPTDCEVWLSVREQPAAACVMVKIAVTALVPVPDVTVMRPTRCCVVAFVVTEYVSAWLPEPLVGDVIVMKLLAGGSALATACQLEQFDAATLAELPVLAAAATG